MGVVYFKRFRMEMDLARLTPSPPALPAGYLWLPWDAALVGTHAETKFRSFADELDANVFPCLAARDGCKRLMQEISHREGFLAEATWLLVYRRGDLSNGARLEYCGTVQGVRDADYGAIQNLGITPEHRGHGLGSCLLHRALDGFRQVGLARAYLEVTARNTGAIRLYERFGFRKVRTVYKTAELAAY
jgi:ribosomal protein S18 acetylase RimI-like enzyme